MYKKLTLIGCLVILLTACNLENGKMFDTAYDFRGLPKAESDPVVTENPQKHQKYEVTVTLKDVPGKFEVAKFMENYVAYNCTYTTNRLAGATALAHYQPEFTLQKVSDTVYRGEFYTDRPLNEDYYDQGICLWENFGIRLGFRANNKQKSTYFSADIDAEVLQKLSGKGNTVQLVFYYAKNIYPFLKDWPSDDGLVTSGMDLQEIKDKDLNLNELFSIKLDIKRI